MLADQDVRGCAVPLIDQEMRLELEEVFVDLGALQTGLESFYAHMNQHRLFDIVNHNTREKIISMHKTHAA